MPRLNRVFALSLFVLALACAAPSASGAEALEALRGLWVVESFGNEPTPPGVSLTLEFVDDDTLKVVYKQADEADEQEVRYTATADGKITVFPPEAPNGEEATWELKDDGKLYIAPDNEPGQVMVLKRPG
ncbi:MAG: hypothetical protein AAGH88_05780 [Planctomycetota bacterium]